MASLATIHPGDIVQCDVKGRRAYALVAEKSGRELAVRPLTPGFTWTTVTGYQVVAHWRRTKNVSKRGTNAGVG